MQSNRTQEFVRTCEFEILQGKEGEKTRERQQRTPENVSVFLNMCYLLLLNKQNIADNECGAASINLLKYYFLK